MNETNKSVLAEMLNNTPVSRFWETSSAKTHVILIAVLAIVIHLLVKIIRHISEWMITRSHARKNPLGFVTQQPKFITLTRLVVSGVTFILYFLAVGLVLAQVFPRFHLATYLASASVIGLAIGFGSQGFVQDLVIGITLIFSDTMDVGDMVDMGGPVGRVEEIGLRFTKLINFYNQEVFIPNRNIGNVSRFPDGGMLAYADIQFPTGASSEKAIQTIANVATGTWAQFGAIILEKPIIGNLEPAQKGGWNFLRVQFKIWPGQGALIETTFRQQMTAAMKALDPNYADWMVVVTYRANSSPG
jgi:moderate conductance mechanosensitive channel